MGPGKLKVVANLVKTFVKSTKSFRKTSIFSLNNEGIMVHEVEHEEVHVPSADIKTRKTSVSERNKLVFNALRDHSIDGDMELSDVEDDEEVGEEGFENFEEIEDEGTF